MLQITAHSIRSSLCTDNQSFRTHASHLKIVPGAATAAMIPIEMKAWEGEMKKSTLIWRQKSRAKYLQFFSVFEKKYFVYLRVNSRVSANLISRILNVSPECTLLTVARLPV